MSAVLLREPGATTTLQDGGRVGHARHGVPRSGPVDRLSHRLAARLAGVVPAEVDRTAAIEVGPHPCTIVAEGEVVVALAGAGASLSGAATGTVAAPCVVRLTDGEQVIVRTSTWAYVVPGAPVDVPAVLGSRSTHARSGLGPVVERGTRLPLGAARDVMLGRRPSPVQAQGPLLLLAGPQTTSFDADAHQLLVTATWRTTTSFDRMGHRLEGPGLTATEGHDIVSDGIVPGALQVPGDGRPFVLTADHQTTGGYPKIAVLSTASLARFVRIPSGHDLRFRWGSEQEASEELRSALDAVEACAAARATPTAAQLATANLVDGVSDGG